MTKAFSSLLGDYATALEAYARARAVVDRALDARVLPSAAQVQRRTDALERVNAIRDELAHKLHLGVPRAPSSHNHQSTAGR